MKTFLAGGALLAVSLAIANPSAARPRAPVRSHLAPRVLNDVIKQYCQDCHNEDVRSGNLSLMQFDAANAPRNGDVAEKMIAKLQAGMMPPPGKPRPAGDTLRALIQTLETQLDASAAAKPNPGGRSFQRLNRAEYTAAIRDLLLLDIDAGVYLPPDTKSENFDNIADVQTLSPTLLDAYLRAASEISWLAVGNPKATPSSATYNVPRTASQTDYVEGAPFGTRGGTSVVHIFPADGQYLFKVLFYHETTGAFAGGNARGELIEISIDGARAAVLDVDRFMTASDPNGVSMATEPIRVRAGPHRVSAAFIPPSYQRVSQDLITPLKWSLNSTSIATAYGFSLLPHLRDLVVTGPFKPTGVSDWPARHALVSCSGSSAMGRGCAQTIVTRLATQAFRRPLTPGDMKSLMGFYDAAVAAAPRVASGAARHESGVRNALEAILASPDFVFRFERATGAAGADTYRVSDLDLASRLSFFIWSSPPDHELLSLAAQGKLADEAVLAREVRRMMADPRASTLATRFAAQWLRLSDLDKVQPDVRQYPNFDEQLRAAMRRETELLFENLVREDRSVLELFTADYTFVNERLAAHYEIPNVAGPEFRRVPRTDEQRRGLLGHASVLMLTSHATRTSPVERGKWVMEVLLNQPPPPPPPGVPDFGATREAKEGRLLTVRERMEEHRSNPTCNSCHKLMDPIGLALEHFDVTGSWRVRDNGAPIDSRADLWDGTKIETPADLRVALLARQETLLRTFTRNLFAYGLGRRVEYYDMPTVRAIVREAAANDHRISSYVIGVVNSPAFRTQKVQVATETKQ